MVEAAVQCAGKLNAGSGIVDGVVVQLECAVANKNIGNACQFREIVLHALDGSHHLTSAILHHHLVLHTFGNYGNFGECLDCHYGTVCDIECLSLVGSNLYFRVECGELLGNQHSESVEYRQGAYHSNRRKHYACDGYSRNYVYCLMALFREKVSSGYV